MVPVRLTVALAGAGWVAFKVFRAARRDGHAATVSALGAAAWACVLGFVLVCVASLMPAPGPNARHAPRAILDVWEGILIAIGVLGAASVSRRPVLLVPRRWR
jgi:hypothetical protein